MVMLGYYNRPEATAETITPEGWLRTGDLGYLKQNGKLVIAGGRLRDMIIRGGENIYPAEIENLMQSHPAVAAVAVFGVPDDYYGEAVGAAVRLEIEATAARVAGLRCRAHRPLQGALRHLPGGDVPADALRKSEEGRTDRNGRWRARWSLWHETGAMWASATRGR